MATDPYDIRFKVRRWTREVTCLDVPSLMRRIPELNLSSAEHTARSKAFLAASIKSTRRYRNMVTCAVANHGDGNGRLISGCYRDHFPEDTKDSLRDMARRAADEMSKSYAHWQAAGRRRGTWLRMKENAKG